MKQRSWLLGCISLLLVVAACTPLAAPRIEVIAESTPAAAEPAPSVSDAAEAEVEVAEVETEAEVEAETEVAPEPLPPAAADETEVEAESEPGSPSITVPAAGFELNSRVLEMAGVGEPGSQLQVLVDGEVVDTVTVRSSGGWYLAVSLDQPGEHQLQLQLLDAAGAVAAETDPITISADFETATSAEAETTTPVETDTDASTEADPGTPAEADEDAPAEAETTTPAEADTDAPAGADEDAPAEADVAPPIFIFPADQADIFLGNLTLLGVGEPGAEVELLVDEELLAAVSVGAGGGWAVTFQPTLGVHQVSAQTPGLDAAEDDLIEIRVVTPSDDYDCSSNPGLVLDDIYIVGTCDTLATVSQQLGIDVEELISANPQVDDPDLIYPGEIISLPQ